MRTSNSGRITLKASLFLGSALALLTPIAATAQQVADTATESVIVTGTRFTGMTAADSAAPVTVVGSDALSHVGEPNLIQSLAQNIPSFNAEALGGDTAALTLSARLRGLNPNDTLVLVDGKRRHSTGNLHVLGGQYQGAATADLDLIPVAGIDHIEVLQDGAAAQYGTDAIAGVVNIILKKKTDGGAITATGGQYYAGDGNTYDVSGNYGFAFGGGRGFVNATIERRFHGFSQRGGADLRLFDNNGVARVQPYSTVAPGMLDYPRVNHIVGDAESLLTTFEYNAGYDITPDISLYSYGTVGRRNARAFENVRFPNQVIASPVLGVAGTYNVTPGESVLYPLGFNPQETLTETDYGYTGGAKGVFMGFNWDLSGTYGKDKDDIGTDHTGNRSLYVDTHTTPTTFYDGSFIAGQATFNADVNRSFGIGMASPLNVAFGLEGREDTFQIKAGDPNSRYKEGAQSYPGFQLSDAAIHSRKNYAEYLDFALAPIDALQLDIAGRHEHYSDFGDASVGKITVRYDFNPTIAIRGTISTGFRAPTIQEEFYSATNVSPTSAIVQLPPNSAAAAILGVKPLQPEASSNYSVGFVTHLFDGLSMTIDGYSISLRNRIVSTGTLFGSGGAINSPIVTTAILAHGNVLDPTVTQTGVSLFLNGISTLTQGVDFSANYNTDFGDYGAVAWTVAANYNQTSISSIAPPPPTLAPGVLLYSKTSLSTLTNASPKEKITFNALWSLDEWVVNLRETIYGPSSVLYSPNGGTYYKNEVGTAGITDLELSRTFTEFFTLSIGGNNLFNKAPENRTVVNATSISDNSNVTNAPLGISPYGINGGYYYGRISIPLN
jgi:iron complex outermembrane receptor protein